MEERLNLDFKLSSYINQHPVIVKFKNATKTIHFTNRIKFINTGATNDIFSNSTSFKPDVKISGDECTIDMCLYVNSGLVEFIRFIGSILQVSTINLIVEQPKFITDSFPFSVYASYLCVGNGPLVLTSGSDVVENYGDYSADYIRWYVSINNYISDIVKRSEGIKVDNDSSDSIVPLESISFTHNMTNLEYICYCKKSVFTNLVELYNYLSALCKFKRIIIHNVDLDEYYNKTKVQFIKNTKDYGVSTKHVEPKPNTLTVSCLISVSEEVCLDTIDIFQDGTFKLNFNISVDMSESKLSSIIQTFLRENIATIFDDLLIKHATYPSEKMSDCFMTVDDYTIVPSQFHSAYLITNINPNNIKKINTILTLQNTESRFASNTSLSLIAHPFINNQIIYDLYAAYRGYETLNENMTRINIIPEIHFTFAGSNLSIFCNKFYTIDELKFELSYLLPLIDIANHSADIDEDLTPTEAIFKRLRNIPVKQNLKHLVAIDPELFGPRKVSKYYRAYSALCQIKEQRPSIITDKEYEILLQTAPQSIIRLTNQTYPDQMLNLACPYERFPILNFHHFNNQKCIVRCTTRQTNPGQYNNCAAELGTELITKSKFTHRSNNVIKYNDNLPCNKYCYLPPEFQEIFPDYVCFNFNSIVTDYNLDDFAQNIYNAICFIVRRNSDKQTYEVMSDYDDSQSLLRYILVIEPESNPDLKYLVLHSSTYDPLYLDQYPNFNDFIRHVYRSVISHEATMSYLNTILHMNIPTDISLYQFIHEICKQGYKLVIRRKVIRAIVHADDGMLFMTPDILFPLQIDGTYYANDYTIKTLRASPPKYPDIKQYITAVQDTHSNYCYDVVSQQITGIFWNYKNSSVLMQTEPMVVDEFDIGSCGIVMYDTSQYLELLLNESPIDFIKIKNQLSISTIFKKLFIMMVYRYINICYYNNLEVSRTKFIDEWKKFGLLYDGSTQLVKRTSVLYDIYNSKVNLDEFNTYLDDNKIMFDETLDDMLYDNIIDNLKLPHDDEEIIIEKQFI